VAARLLGVSRLVVVGSTLLAVAAGLWPLAGNPWVCAGLAAMFVGAAGLARWRPDLAPPVVLAFAYVNYGVARLIVGPELAAIPYWLAAFAGMAIGGVPWTRWEADGRWRVPLAWWATGVAVTWPVFAARDLGFTVTPSVAAAPIVTAAVTQMAVALWMDRLLAARGADAPAHDRLLPLARWAWPLAASALLTSVAAIYQRFVDPAWLSGEPWIGLRRSVGMMGDANPAGVAAALWAPLAWTMAGGSPTGVVAGGVAAAVMWTAAWMTGARTTIILMGAGIAGSLVAVTMARRVSRRVVIGAAASAGIVVGILAVIAVPRAMPESPLGRLVAAAPTSSPDRLLYELLWRRDGYGLAAVAAIREHPVVGVGVGRFTRLAPAYFRRIEGRVIPPDNAQNFWRHTLAEQGLLGLLPVLWLTVLAGRALFSRTGSSLGLMMRMMLAGLSVALVFGYPLQDPAIAVTLGTLTAAIDRDGKAAQAVAGA